MSPTAALSYSHQHRKPFTREPFRSLTEINIYGLARLLTDFARAPDLSCQLHDRFLVCIKDSVVSIKAAYCQISSRKNTELDDRGWRLLQWENSGGCWVAVLSHVDGIFTLKGYCVDSNGGSGITLILMKTYLQNSQGTFSYFTLVSYLD